MFMFGGMFFQQYRNNFSGEACIHRMLKNEFHYSCARRHRYKNNTSLQLHSLISKRVCNDCCFVNEFIHLMKWADPTIYQTLIQCLGLSDEWATCLTQFQIQWGNQRKYLRLELKQFKLQKKKKKERKESVPSSCHYLVATFCFNFFTIN